MGRIYAPTRRRLFGPEGPNGSAHRVTITTPWSIRVVCHRLIVDVFLDACRAATLADPTWIPQRIDSYANRPIRGRTEPSLHAWGLAFDFFATPPNVPPPGGVWTPHNGMPVDFATEFVLRGFTWGATWARKDIPHLEWAGPPPPEEDDMPQPTDIVDALVVGGDGAYLLQADGGVLTKGNVAFHGSIPGLDPADRQGFPGAAAITYRPDGRPGYTIWDRTGHDFNFPT